ncbi:MAG: AAA family ATPase [Alphaproteobacteria bacterium]|nr:AAA family ATPase [Alphaproteobacteria bacterium]
MSTGVDALQQLLDRVGPPPAGAPAVVLGPEGVGKTALLVHVALEALLSERRVLHVSVQDSVDHVRAHYDALLRAVHRLEGAAHAQALVAIERRRLVLSYAERELDVDHLGEQAAMLADVAQFRPDLVVVDTLHGDTWSAVGAALARWSRDTDVPMWVGVSAEGTLPHGGGTPAFVLRLVAAEVGMALHLDMPDRTEVLPWALDAASLVLGGAQALEEPEARLEPARCTLYSGGAAGAEACFGEAAARHGLREVHYTFEGHRQAREVGAVVLSPRELEAGDVSLVYVSRRLHRTYNQHGLIRKVLQTLWHMVSRAQQVFVVGVIQEDGTVVGGTGWSVELARMWSKELWVFDQDRRGWYRWSGITWVSGQPSISSLQICGTGTRYLDDHGRTAIDELFARAFSEPGRIR